MSPEWIAIEDGVKPSLRYLEGADRIVEIEGWARAGGLAAVCGPIVRRRQAIYVARDRDAAIALREAERDLLAPRWGPALPGSRRRAIRRVGSLLGYPACCVDAYAARAGL